MPSWLDELQLGENKVRRGFGHSHMPSKTLRTSQVVILIFILCCHPEWEVVRSFYLL